MTLHTSLSYIKSVMRIIGFSYLGFDNIPYATTLLIIAEIIGILEELPGSYVGTKMDEEPAVKPPKPGEFYNSTENEGH